MQRKKNKFNKTSSATSFSIGTDFRTSVKYVAPLRLQEKEKVSSVGENHSRQIIPSSGPCRFSASLFLSLSSFSGARPWVFNNVKVPATTGTNHQNQQPKTQQRRGAPETLGQHLKEIPSWNTASDGQTFFGALASASHSSEPTCCAAGRWVAQPDSRLTCKRLSRHGTIQKTVQKKKFFKKPRNLISFYFYFLFFPVLRLVVA